MTTYELINALRQKVTSHAVGGDKGMALLLNEAADRLEELDERVALMEDSMGKTNGGKTEC